MTRNQEIASMYRRGKSCTVIGRKFGLSNQSVLRIAREYGLSKANAGPFARSRQEAQARAREIYLKALIRKHRLLDKLYPPMVNMRTWPA